MGILVVILGVVIFTFVVALIAPVVKGVFTDTSPAINTTEAIVFPLIIIFSSFILYTVVTGQQFKGFSADVRSGKLEFELSQHVQETLEVTRIEPRSLDAETREQREEYAEKYIKDHALPGQDAPRFSAIVPSNADELLVRPSAYPTTPMYLLDNAYRIIDWNEAFTIAFDRTMEGRKGRGVLEWTYFLDNYEEVLDHGAKTFSGANQLPRIDVETIEYTSLRYGKLTATKRAYQIPDDNGDCMAWLVTLDPRFEDSTQQLTFQQDIIRVLSLDLMWSDYAMSYDRLLNATKSYPELLHRLIGGYDGVAAIPQHARVLDLGAGTGNLTEKLIVTGRDRIIFAAENNRTMLEILRAKCKRFLRSDAEAGGVIAFKQDITSLFGLEDGYFDYAIMNNVLYAVQDAEACLKETVRVLKSGGELRLSGPRRDSDLDVLFKQFEEELKESNQYDELEPDFHHVHEINRLKLKPMLHRWSNKDVEQLLLDCGFSRISHSSTDTYAGQSMIVCAVK